MVDDVARLFVYGTLMSGERNAAQIPAGLVRRRRPARVRGTLIDLGRYPALCTGSDDDGVVHGELLELAPGNAASLLARLDAFEGPGYARTALTVHVDDGVNDGEADVVAWVFVQVSGGPGGPRIPAGDWRAYRRRA